MDFDSDGLNPRDVQEVIFVVVDEIAFHRAGDMPPYGCAT